MTSGFNSFEGETSGLLDPAWRQGRQQIRAVAARFLQRLFHPPAPNLFVIAAEQNLRNRPAAEFGGASVVGEVENAVIRDL